MEIISHRGNLNGPLISLENKPEYILAAAEQYKVEIDVWQTKNGFFLGHDKPMYSVDKLFLFDERFLVHCKNIEAFLALRRHSGVEVFFQEAEAAVISNRGRLILHSRVTPSHIHSIGHATFVDLGRKESTNEQEHVGLITDFPDAVSPGKRLNALPFDLLILDIDGVMTPGTKMYGLDGAAFGKTYCDKDFTAIKRFQAAGITVVFLSGDRQVNEKMASARGVDFYFARLPDGNIDKSVFLRELVNQYGAAQTAYVGDDYFDITLLDIVDFSYAPADANSEVLSKVSTVLKVKGGEGVVAELFDITMSGIAKSFTYDSVEK